MSWGDGGREPISASAGYVTVILLTQIFFFFLFCFLSFLLFVFLSSSDRYICYCHSFHQDTPLLLSDVAGSDFKTCYIWLLHLVLVYCGWTENVMDVYIAENVMDVYIAFRFRSLTLSCEMLLFRSDMDVERGNWILQHKGAELGVCQKEHQNHSKPINSYSSQSKDILSS